MRKYKENSPLNTIRQIRRILMDADITLYESQWFNPLKEVYSVRVMTFLEDGRCGQNGKGRTEQLALASAYAEFMERLQNKIIIRKHADDRIPAELLNKIKKQTGFYYFPDEKIIEKKEMLALSPTYLIDAFGTTDFTLIERKIEEYIIQLRNKGLPGVIAIPFYNYESGKVIHLPYDLTISFLGSNGMCAGNTPYEAIFQGLCELIERYSTAYIFHKQLTPPSVPDSVLSQYPQEFAIINQIREQGYTVIIKDFSCGLQLPAVGALIINKIKNTYKLNIGSETSFQFALSRTLTEIFQGITLHDFDNVSLPIPEKEYSFFLHDDLNSINKRNAELEKFFANNQGLFPYALFGEQPAYPLSITSTFHVKESYKEEVHSLINKIQKLGSSVYVRDVSFLGFPSFLIYATGISNLGKKFSENDLLYGSAWNDKCLKEACEQIIFPLNSFWEDYKRLRLFLDLFNDLSLDDINIPMQEILSLKLADTRWPVMPLSFFISLFYFLLSDYTNALKYLHSFIKHIHAENNPYYKELVRYYSLLQQNPNTEEIKKNIHTQIIEDFSIKNIFSIIKVPRCPLCDICPLQGACITEGQVNLYMKILKKSTQTINQQNIFL